jgi:hypothetical protein
MIIIIYARSLKHFRRGTTSNNHRLSKISDLLSLPQTDDAVVSDSLTHHCPVFVSYMGFYSVAGRTSAAVLSYE